MVNGLALSTSKKYSAAQGVFARFCLDLGVAPVPCDSHSLLKFIAWLKRLKNLGPEAIRGYLAAVRHLHSINGYEFKGDADPRVKLARRAANKRVSPKDGRLPITRDILSRLAEAGQVRDGFGSRLFLAAATLGYAGWLRISEICGGAGGGGPVGLRGRSLIVKGNSLSLMVERGKTDKAREGVEIGVLAGRGAICPIKALLRYLEVRPGAPSADGFLLVREDCRRMDQAWFRAELQTRCKEAGLGAGFNTHSLRIGAATDAGRGGMPSYLIKLRGRWRSDAFLSYVRPSCSQLAEVAARGSQGPV